MGIYFDYEICVIDKDGNEVYHNPDTAEFPLMGYFRDLFFEHNFHRSDMARLIGYDVNNLEHLPRDRSGHPIARRTFDELEAAIGDDWSYIEFKLFLIGMRMMKEREEWKDVQLVIYCDHL